MQLSRTKSIDPTHLAKLLSLYARGVITTPEITNSLLGDLIRDEGPDTELLSFVAGLPDEVRQKLRDLLGEIQGAGYLWRPFTLGPGGSVLHSQADDSARLRHLCEVLRIAQPAAASDPRRGSSEGV